MGIINHFSDDEEEDDESGVIASHWHKKYKEECGEEYENLFSHLKEEKPEVKKFKDVD